MGNHVLQCSGLQYDTVQHSAVPVQCSAVQYHTVQYGIDTEHVLTYRMECMAWVLLTIMSRDLTPPEIWQKASRGGADRK